MRQIAGFALALTLSAPLAAQPAPAPVVWPREVQAIFDGYKTQCIKAGGKFVPDRARFATSAELTGDGKPDWVVEDSAFDCKVPQSVLDSGGDYPETGSGFCGTAGCTLTILGSTRKGLTPIFEGNLRDWKAVDLGGGRRGIETSVHGSACGGVGAEVCIETLAWNGKKWALVKRYRWTDADYEADQRRQAALPAYQEPPGHTARWVFGGQGAGAVAAVTGHPELGTLGLRCQMGGGISLTVVPPAAGALHLPGAGQPLLLSFEGSTDGIMADLALAQEPGKPDWTGPLDPVLEMLLGGRDDGLSVLASTDGGEEWQDLAYFSLAGSTKALRSLQTQCAAAQGTAPAGVTDEAAVAAIVGAIYGFRDGKKVAQLSDWDALYSPRIRALLDQCSEAIDKADPQANGGEGAYAVVGDQGCQGVPFLIDPMSGDIPRSIMIKGPVVRRISDDVVEAETVLPPAEREGWWEGLSSQTIRFQRISGRWQVDEILSKVGNETSLYSSAIADTISELRKIARKTRQR